MEKANLCGHRVKLARIDNNMKQVELAAALSVDHGIEISQKSISDIECGARKISDIELVMLSKVLKVSTDWLLFGDKHKK